MKIDQPLKEVLRKPEIVGGMVAWSVELLELGLWFKPRGPIKGQCLANFIVELPLPRTTMKVDGLCM